MGIPLPGETILISAALYAGSTHRLAIGWVMLVAAAAATVGGMIGYVIGRWIGLRLLVHYGKYVRLMSAVSRSVSISFFDMAARSSSSGGSLTYCESLPLCSPVPIA